MANRLNQHITVEESTSIQWVKSNRKLKISEQAPHGIWVYQHVLPVIFIKMGSILKDRICYTRSKFFPYRVDLQLRKGAKITISFWNAVSRLSAQFPCLHSVTKQN